MRQRLFTDTEGILQQRLYGHRCADVAAKLGVSESLLHDQTLGITDLEPWLDQLVSDLLGEGVGEW